MQWPVELPSSQDEVAQSPELKFLTNDEFFKAMAAEIRANVIKAFRASIPDASNSAIVIKGGTEADFALYDSDCLKTEFRQEAFFQYLFGLNEPDCYGVIDCATGETVLFVSEVPADAERWNGPNRPFAYYREKYGVDQAYSTADIERVLHERGVKTLHTLWGRNSDSGESTKTVPDFKGIESFNVDNSLLYPLLAELRVFKTAKEIDLLRVACIVSSQAHVYVMRHIRPGMTEFQLEALYKAWCHYHGAARHMAYTCICGSGEHGSILHYGHAGRPNDRILKCNDSVVLDMGAEYRGYATDITRSYVVGGTFSDDQRLIHDAVREAQFAVFAAMRPGVRWPDMHRLAERVILTHLLRGKLVHNGTVDEMMAAHIGAIFMPHGLGHLIGMNVHDVGGYLAHTPARIQEPGVCYLRTARQLEKGMFLTVEPGCYFNNSLIDKALANPIQANFLNPEVLNRFRGTGGVRLEDCVIVTDDGIENLTILPTLADEIEEVIAMAQRPSENH